MYFRVTMVALSADLPTGTNWVPLLGTKLFFARHLIERADAKTMTAQIPDRIRYKRRIHALSAEPLEDWFNDQNPRPAFFSESRGSNCWRGYRAMWSIRRGQLHLLWIDPQLRSIGEHGDSLADQRRYYLSQLFPMVGDSVFAEWFSGELVLHSGRKLSVDESPDCYAWEHQTVLQVKEGLVTAETMGLQQRNEG